MSVSTLRTIQPRLTSCWRFKYFIVAYTEYHWAHCEINCFIEGKSPIPWFNTAITLTGYIEDWREVIEPIIQLDKDINLYLHALW